MTYDELVKLGAKPGPENAPAPAADGKGLTFEQLQALGAKPGGDEPAAPAPPLPTPEPTKADAFLRSAANGASFGFGPAVAGGLDWAASKIPGVRTAFGALTGNPSVNNPDVPYSERRKAYSDPLDAARAAHPWVSTVGDVIGGTPGALLLPEAKAAQALGPGARAAVAGAQFGGLQGAGEAVSHGKNLADTLAETRKGALVGGATGGAFGALGGKLVEGAPKAAKDWVVKDIIGDAKTASKESARKNLARDAEDVGNLLAEDKKLDGVIDAARHGDKDAIEVARLTVKSKLAEVGKPRSDLYAEADAALPGGGVRAGDVVKSIDESIAERLKTGKGHDAGEARELQKIADRMRTAEDWGAETSTKLDPRAEADVNALSAVRNNVRDPAKLAEIDQQLESLKATGKPSTSYNPDKIVPLEQLRDLVTDTQNTAYEAERGGLQATSAFLKAKEVSNVLRDVLDEHLDRAAAQVPDTVESIKEMNWRLSALKNIQAVLDQRSLKATQDALGAGMHGGVGNSLRKLAHTNPAYAVGGGLLAGFGGVHVPGIHPGIAGTAIAAAPFAAKGAIAGKRLLDRGVAGLVDQAGGAATARAGMAGYRVLDRIMAMAKSGPVRASLILEAIQSGIPREMALWAAKSADHGILNDVGEGAEDAIQSAVGQ